MVAIKPFYNILPTPDRVQEVASPPYDVVSTKEARALAKGKPHSYLHVIRAEIDLPPDTDPYAPAVYEKAKENFQRFLSEGILQKEPEPHLYLYELTMEGRTQRGLVAGVSAEEYGKGLIKVHEKTLKKKEDDRINYILKTQCHLEPVFLTYPSKPEVDSLLKKAGEAEPLFAFTTDDLFGKVDHRFWRIEDKNLENQLIHAFKTLPALYVADGHHRTASAYRTWLKLKSSSSPFFPAVIFPHKELYIFDYNRIIKDLQGLTWEAFLRKAKEKFEVSRLYTAKKPEERHTFTLYHGSNWYQLRIKQELVDENHPYQRLDSALIHEHLIRPILGIENPKTDPRIDFVGGIRGLEALKKAVDSGSYVLAIALYPTSMEEVMAVADAGLTMPPKSTWFEPKLRSGFIIHLL